ncbi:ABC transporter substrate-binding protein [Nitrospira sp. Kam-Ns4a]
MRLRQTLAMWASSLLLMPGAGPADAPAGAAPAIELRFISWKPDHPRVWEEAIARFAEAHPAIRIVREIAPHSSTAYHDLLTQKLKNRDAAVDLFFMDVVWVPEFAAAGWVRPLDDWFGPAEQAQFLPAAVEAGRYRGRLYGVPSRIDGGLLYYRADLLERYGFAPPETWEELVHQAQTIVASEAARHPALRGYTGQFKQYEGLVCNMLEFIVSGGGRLLAEDGLQTMLAAPEALAAVRFVRDRLLTGLASRAVLTYQEPESLAAFVRGHAVFHRNWPYAWQIANDPARSTVAGRVGVAPLPRFAGGRRAAALGGWLYGINAESRHPEAAWAFIRFLASPEIQRLFAVQAGIAPSRVALFDEPEVRRAAPQWKALRPALEAATPRPRTPLYPALSHRLQRYFSRALAVRDTDLAGEAAAADRQIARLLALTGGEP